LQKQTTKLQNKNDKRIDTLNFHVAEMRKPKWQEASKSPDKFNKTYLPNG
jgi:hypothetical protein